MKHMEHMEHGLGGSLKDTFVWASKIHQKRILKVSKGLFVQKGSLTLPRSAGMDCVGGNMLKHPFICIKITCGHFSFAPIVKNLSSLYMN